jgi:hypothetical protein
MDLLVSKKGPFEWMSAMNGTSILPDGAAQINGWFRQDSRKAHPSQFSKNADFVAVTVGCGE